MRKISYILGVISVIGVLGCTPENQAEIVSTDDLSYAHCYTGGAQFVEGTVNGNIVIEEGIYVFESRDIEISAAGEIMSIPRESTVRVSGDCVIYSIDIE